ncbi:PREDICTED: uncharacterized protein LOC109220355 [Nicotiana attenuata]|uniref:uncharacterized protein LOC109220355 n=1 Tax=Nicotiana attenuata TaxID=49451 RepID=UPI000904DB63|nr:PREDICTED: uncharacterized protein LOC109220355 [Nicotiana attenuata]
MASTAGDQPLPEVGPSSPSPLQPFPTSTNPNTNPNPPKTYANLLNPTVINTHMQTLATLKPIEFLHGEPIVKWKKQEVKQSIVQQGLQLAVLGKFSYGKPVIVGLIEDNHVLIRLSLLEDYVHLLSNPAFYLKAQLDMWQMRCTKWNPWWTPDEETPIAIAWISFPELPPNFFGKECVFSLARAVGNPLHVDLATQNGTRPSCAKVKVKVNLLGNIPKRIKIVEEADESGPEEFKLIRIKYDYMPKYCKPCKKQGHSEAECWVIHPELHKRFDEDVEDQGKEKTIVVSTEAIGTAANSTKVLSSGKVVGKPATNHAKQEWIQARKNKYQRDNRGHIVDNKQSKEADKGKGKAKLEEVVIKNKFNALEVEEVYQPILQITEGKGEDHSNAGESSQQELKRVKKEAVKKLLEDQHNGNLTKDNPIVPSDQSSDAIEVEDDQIGTTKTTGDKVRDNSPPSDRLATPGLKPGSTGVRLATPGLAPRSPNEATIVNLVTSATGKILAYVDGVPMYVLENKLDDNVKVRDDTVGSENNSEKNDEHAIVPRAFGEIEEVPMEYGTDQIM